MRTSGDHFSVLTCIVTNTFFFKCQMDRYDNFATFVDQSDGQETFGYTCPCISTSSVKIRRETRPRRHDLYAAKFFITRLKVFFSCFLLQVRTVRGTFDRRRESVVNIEFASYEISDRRSMTIAHSQCSRSGLKPRLGAVLRQQTFESDLGDPS